MTGEAWLDREWSSNYLAPDRAGLGLDRAQPRRRLRADGVPHPAQGRRHALGGRLAAPRRRQHRRCSARATSRFRPLATWRSKATGALYPVIAGTERPRRRRHPALAPDADVRRAGTRRRAAAACRSIGRARCARRGGRGYLELTGYDRPLEDVTPRGSVRNNTSAAAASTPPTDVVAVQPPSVQLNDASVDPSRPAEEHHRPCTH